LHSLQFFANIRYNINGYAIIFGISDRYRLDERMVESEFLRTNGDVVPRKAMKVFFK